MLDAFAREHHWHVLKRWSEKWFRHNLREVSRWPVKYPHAARPCAGHAINLHIASQRHKHYPKTKDAQISRRLGFFPKAL
jgi:hypothetical protein